MVEVFGRDKHTQVVSLDLEEDLVRLTNVLSLSDRGLELTQKREGL